MANLKKPIFRDLRVAELVEIAAVSGSEKSESLKEEIFDRALNILPAKIQLPAVRNIRHSLFAVYARLFSLVFLGNLAALIWICSTIGPVTLDSLGVLCIPITVNLFVASLFRTDDFINLLFSTVLLVPTSLPLSVRRRLAKIYEFGGVHSGCGVACTLWAILFVVRITQQLATNSTTTRPTGILAVAITYMLILLLIVMLIAAHPQFRSKRHNSFEVMHRITAWIALALFWGLLIVLTMEIAISTSQTLARALFTSPPVYFLLGTSFLTVLPWLRLRRLSVIATPLSAHATRIYFPGPSVGSVQTVRLSTSPFWEWHSFAAIPRTKRAYVADPDTPVAFDPAFSIVVSAAGDWTKAVIASPSPEHK